jgi:hypothetical protein
MFSISVYYEIKNALVVADIGEARKAYIKLGTVENARMAFEVAAREVIKNGGDVNDDATVKFFLDHKRRDNDDTPSELRNINYPKLLDEIIMGDKVKVYTPKPKKDPDADVKEYVPKKKTPQVFDLTGKESQGKI